MTTGAVPPTDLARLFSTSLIVLFSSAPEHDQLSTRIPLSFRFYFHTGVLFTVHFAPPPPPFPPLRLSPKKTSSGAFTRDSRHVVWGDKYGDVLIGACSSRNDPAKPQRPALLLGHLCSVVAALSVSPDNRYDIGGGIV